MTASTYTGLRSDSSKVTIYLRNLSAKPVKIPAKATMASGSTTNIIPHMLVLKIKTIEDNQEEGSDAHKGN